LSRIVSATCFF